MSINISFEEIKKFWPSSAPNIKNINKYVNKYKSESIVIKCGGNVLIDNNLFDNFIDDIIILNKLGLSIIVVHGGGPRIKKELEKDKDSRRCTIVIGQPYHKTKNWHDIPCTQYLQVFIRDNKLHLGVNMRSNDIIFGMCNDIFNFALFQQLMLNELREIYPDLELGSYYHQAGSLHLYDMHYNMRDNILMDASKYFDADTLDRWILKPEITIDYIDNEKIFLPQKSMEKLELVDFTNKQIKKLFI